MADQCVYGTLRQTTEWQRIDGQIGGVQNMDDIRILSSVAETQGCGNCGELTARTFMYLYHLGVRPLDYMMLEEPADHAFVVIGRRGSRDDDALGRNWGKSAMVCDPWAYRLNKALAPGVSGPAVAFGASYTAYSAVLLEQKMREMHAKFNGVRVAVTVRT